jgi:hypothetical protein
MSKANPRAVADRYLLIKKAREINSRNKTASRVKTAGEVRFIKDHGDDSNAWAWGQHPPSQRTMDPNHSFNQKCNKNIVKVLRSTLSALGHAMSAYSNFAKIKSRDISPDGNLGGRGYIMEIKAIRRQYMNVVEALSAMSDTLYDEITADHWKVEQNKMLSKVMDDIEEIKEDPEGWAVEVEHDDDYRPKQLDEDGNEKTRDFASPRKVDK